MFVGEFDPKSKNIMLLSVDKKMNLSALISDGTARTLLMFAEGN